MHVVYVISAFLGGVVQGRAGSCGCAAGPPPPPLSFVLCLLPLPLIVHISLPPPPRHTPDIPSTRRRPPSLLPSFSPLLRALLQWFQLDFDHVRR